MQMDFLSIFSGQSWETHLIVCDSIVRTQSFLTKSALSYTCFTAMAALRHAQLHYGRGPSLVFQMVLGAFEMSHFVA